MHTTTLRMRFRYKIIAENSYNSVKVSIRITGGKEYEVILQHASYWAISESRDITFLKNVENFVSFAMVKSANIVSPSLYLDYMELFSDESYQQNNIWAYDIDDHDQVQLSLINGHMAGIQQLFNIEPKMPFRGINPISNSATWKLQRFSLFNFKISSI